MPTEQEQQKPSEEEQPKYITADEVAQMVTGAVTQQLKRALPKALEGFDAKLADLVTKTIKENLPPPPAPPPDDKGPTKDPEVKKQLEDMAAKLEASEKRFAESERARADIERQRSYDAAKTTLTGALKDKAHPDYLDDWVRAVEPRLQVADDGSATLKIKHSPFKGSPEVEEELPLDQAVPKLLERPEFKKYQAAPAPPDGKGGRAPRAAGTGAGTPRRDSDNPLDRVSARLAELGMSFDETFGS